MLAIPAIDIMGGKVVRLLQGDPKRQTVYGDSPLAMAEKWASYGVSLIHIVDLDGAIKGELVNFGIVKEIAKAIKAKVELGGGIRDEATIKTVLDSGIAKVVIGTRALDEGFLSKLDAKVKSSVVVGIDAREGMVHTKGWLEKTSIKAVDLAKKMELTGIETINYTDISKDGTLEGPNLKSLKELLKATKLRIVASGGVSTIDDIKKLKALEKDGLAGVIIGKALYEGTLDLAEAVRVCTEKSQGSGVKGKE